MLRILDGGCKAGGASEGYRRAGWMVDGIDIEPQPNYRAGRFILRDALDYIGDCWREYDAVHVSPNCEASGALFKGTNTSKGWGEQHVNDIPKFRKLLKAIKVPTVMENVQGSDLRRDMILCGELFGLRVIRRRYFELNGFKFDGETLRCRGNAHHRARVAGYRHGVNYAGYYVATYGDGGGKGSVRDWQNALGIHWTTDKKELAKAIPPAYTYLIGTQLREALS